MKRSVLLKSSVIVLAMLAAGQAMAAPTYTFDFDDLGFRAENEAIGSYMTAIYGSTVTVNDGVIASYAGQLAELCEDDQILRPIALQQKEIVIHFEKAITSVRFDWAILDFGENSAFHAYADGEEFFVMDTGSPTWWGVCPDDGKGTSDLFLFDSPIHSLKFTDSCVDVIEIDNLMVTAVPAPGAVLLCGIGSMLAGYMKRRKSL